jgi:hypothetical protein
MKKLDISNYADLKDYQIKNWIIYATNETNTEYLFKLKCIDGNTTHAAVVLSRKIKEGKVEVRVMYRSYSDVIWSGYLPLSQFKDKEQFWLMLESYIEAKHKSIYKC